MAYTMCDSMIDDKSCSPAPDEPRLRFDQYPSHLRLSDHNNLQARQWQRGIGVGSFVDDRCPTVWDDASPTHHQPRDKLHGVENQLRNSTDVRPHNIEKEHTAWYDLNSVPRYPGKVKHIEGSLLRKLFRATQFEQERATRKAQECNDEGKRGHKQNREETTRAAHAVSYEPNLSLCDTNLKHSERSPNVYEARRPIPLILSNERPKAIRNDPITRNILTHTLQERNTSPSSFRSARVIRIVGRDGKKAVFEAPILPLAGTTEPKYDSNLTGIIAKPERSPRTSQEHSPKQTQLNMERSGRQSDHDTQSENERRSEKRAAEEALMSGALPAQSTPLRGDSRPNVPQRNFVSTPEHAIRSPAQSESRKRWIEMQATIVSGNSPPESSRKSRPCSPTPYEIGLVKSCTKKASTFRSFEEVGEGFFPAKETFKESKASSSSIKADVPHVQDLEEVRQKSKVLDEAAGEHGETNAPSQSQAAFDDWGRSLREEDHAREETTDTMLGWNTAAAASPHIPSVATRWQEERRASEKSVRGGDTTTRSWPGTREVGRNTVVENVKSIGTNPATGGYRSRTSAKTKMRSESLLSNGFEASSEVCGAGHEHTRRRPPPLEQTGLETEMAFNNTTTVRSHKSERDIEETQTPARTVFAGKGWISPHPLSCCSSGLESPPQSKIHLPFAASPYGPSMTYQEWKEIQERGIRAHRNFSCTESSRTRNEKLESSRYVFAGWGRRATDCQRFEPEVVGVREPTTEREHGNRFPSTPSEHSSKREGSLDSHEGAGWESPWSSKAQTVSLGSSFSPHNRSVYGQSRQNSSEYSRCRTLSDSPQHHPGSQAVHNQSPQGCSNSSEQVLQVMEEGRNVWSDVPRCNKAVSDRHGLRSYIEWEERSRTPTSQLYFQRYRESEMGRSACG